MSHSGQERRYATTFPVHPFAAADHAGSSIDRRIAAGVNERRELPSRPSEFDRPIEGDSAIWHFGWGSTAMESDYQKRLANGMIFQTPITRLGSGLLFAYMKAPDGALVEINTSTIRAFIRVHLYSDAPLCAADWYVKRLGATSRAQRGGPCEVPFAAPSEPLGVIRAPAATVRFGEISLIIYPRQRPGPLVSPRGHVVDHIALSIPDLAGALDRLRKSGVKVLEELHQFGDSKMRAAMIEGPDSIAIELIEAAPRP